MNEELVEHQNGVFGTFNFSYGKYNLVVTTKLKTNHILTVAGVEIPLIKIKKKDLQKLLSDKGIHNEVNPTAEQFEQIRFKPKVLILPILLMVGGFVLQYFLHSKPFSMQLIAMIPEAIAGWMLYDIVVGQFVWLKHLKNGRLGFMAIVVVGLGILGEFIFPYI